MTAAPASSLPRTRRKPSRLRGRSTWAARRIAIGLVLLLVVSLLIFAATQALPGDVARMILGRDASADQVAVLQAQLNLDAPFLQRYLEWLGGVLTGDFGKSFAANMPVSDLVMPRVVNSVVLVLVSMSIAVPIAVFTGIASAWARGRGLDRVFLWTSLGINALPEFVIALLLTVLLATNVLPILPAVSLISPSFSLISQWQNLVLPGITLVLLQSTYLYRLVRSSMIDVLTSDYIEFAELRGLHPARIVFRHALPNAVVPAIQAAATVFAFSVGGVVVIEYAFGFPGIGTALTDAVRYRDIEVVQFIVLLIAATFFISNMVADLAAALLTPPSRGATS